MLPVVLFQWNHRGYKDILYNLATLRFVHTWKKAHYPRLPSQAMSWPYRFEGGLSQNLHRVCLGTRFLRLLHPHYRHYQWWQDQSTIPKELGVDHRLAADQTSPCLHWPCYNHAFGGSKGAIWLLVYPACSHPDQQKSYLCCDVQVIWVGRPADT